MERFDFFRTLQSRSSLQPLHERLATMVKPHMAFGGKIPKRLYAVWKTGTFDHQTLIFRSNLDPDRTLKMNFLYPQPTRGKAANVAPSRERKRQGQRSRVACGRYVHTRRRRYVRRGAERAYEISYDGVLCVCLTRSHSLSFSPYGVHGDSL